MNALPAHYFVMYVPLPVGPVTAGSGDRVVPQLPIGGSSLEAMSPQSWLSGPSPGSSQDVFPQARPGAASSPIVLPSTGPAAPFEWKTPEPSPRFWEGGAPGGSEMAAPDATPTFIHAAGQEPQIITGCFTASAANSPTAGQSVYQGSPVRQGSRDVTTPGHHDDDRSVWPDRPFTRLALQEEISWGRGCGRFNARGMAPPTSSASSGPGSTAGRVQFPGFLRSQESWTIDWSESWGNVLQQQMQGRNYKDYTVYNKKGEVIDPFQQPPEKNSFPLLFIEKPRGSKEQAGICPWSRPSLRSIPRDFTTLAVRNIPARYSQDMLLMEFQPDGTFDLFYQPYSFRDGRTMGYVFINFRNHEMALAFQQKWHRQYLRDHGKTKHLDVAAATVQGVRENLTQFNLRSVVRLRRVSMLPALFSETGQRLDTVAELVRMGIVPFDNSLFED